MKTDIKIKVTPEQAVKIQEICFANKIYWGNDKKAVTYTGSTNLYIHSTHISRSSDGYFFQHHNSTEVDADLFIRTNGTCEENNCLFKVKDRVRHISGRIGTITKVNNSDPLAAITVKFDTGENGHYCKDGKFMRYARTPSIVLYKEKSTQTKAKTNTQQKETTMQRFFKVFHKDGTINISGLFYQALHFSDPRPFVIELMEKERVRVTKVISKLKFTSPYYYNIKLAYLTKLMKELQVLETPLTNNDIVNFYKYEKELKNKEKYLWIQAYLTKENLGKRHMDLFVSNNRSITISNGNLCLEEKDRYIVPITYDETTFTFGI